MIGSALMKLLQLDFKRPSEDILKVILQCSVECLNNSEQKKQEMFNSYILQLSTMMHAFIKWSVNVDEYHNRFWLQLFQEIQLYFSKIDTSDTFLTTTLKRIILKDIILVTLLFDKVNDFEVIKNYWQLEMESVITEFPKTFAAEILSVAAQCGKSKQLELLTSKKLYDSLKTICLYS